MRTSHPAPRRHFRHAPLAAAVAALFSQGALGATVITVINDQPSGTGSFYEAIGLANAACEGGDSAPVIQFSGPFTISQSTPLPAFQCFTNANGYTPSIDAMTNTGATANTQAVGYDASLTVVVDGGSNFSMYGCALNMIDTGYGGKLAVKGLDVRNFNYGGFEWAVCGAVNLIGNRFTNNGNGVQARDGSTIGGPSPADRNVITTFSYGTGIDLDGGDYAIVNNYIGTPDGASTASMGYAITNCSCTSVSGTIANNVIAASYTGIDLYGDDVMSISGNKIGTNAVGTGFLGSGNYGIALYFSYGAQISDNVINGAGQYGIVNYYGDGVVISNNRIGTDDSGNSVLGNFIGIHVQYAYGTDITGGNVISGNQATGIELYGVQDTTVISGNMIGVNRAGNSALGNGWEGIYAGVAAEGTVTISGNTVSGNADQGIYLSDLSSSTISDNRIGTDSTGSVAIPNDSDGLRIECGTGLVVSGNTISGNGSDGIEVNGILSSTFSGNTIGVSRTGGQPLPNSNSGIELSGTDCGQQAQLNSAKRAKARTARVSVRPSAKALVPGYYMSDGNTFTGNIVSYNGDAGIYISEGSTNTLSANLIEANVGDGLYFEIGVGNDYGTNNSIHGNGLKNASLFDGGVLGNDPGDADGNPPDTPKANNWQNKPVITAASRNPTTNQTTIDFQLDSEAATFRVDLYSNPGIGKAAGKKWLTSTTVTIAAPGATNGQFVLNGIGEDFFSAVATRGNGDSSEFAEIFPSVLVPTPAATVVPTSIDFGDVVIGQESSPGTVTITSEGTAPYLINALRDGSCTGPQICTSGGFVCTTNCLEATPYSAGASCTINAKFAPATTGPQSKTLALCDNTSASPRTITFSGNGLPVPDVNIFYTPSSWAFGEVLVGQRGESTKTFTLTNASASTVYLGPVRLSGDFVLNGNTCGATIAAGATCATDVAFLPTAKGTLSGTLEVTGSNVPPDPMALRTKVTSPSTTTAVARLSGVGAQFGELRLPGAISFGTLVLNSAPSQLTVTLSNTGNGPLALGSISVSGPFTLISTCGSSLGAGESCTLTLEFNPSGLGTANGTLTVASDASGGTRAIPIQAVVSPDARPVVRVNPTTLGFGSRQMGSESPAHRVTITNEGAQAAILSPITFTQPEPSGNSSAQKVEFTISSTNCGGTLAPQGSCFADILFKPLGIGARLGEMQVNSNSADSPRRVTVGGSGCSPLTPSLIRSGRDPCRP